MKLPYLSTTLVLLAPLGSARQAVQENLTPRWEEIGPVPITSGPYTGRVSAIVCSPSDPNRAFVGGADGGVWRTQDGGQSWQPLTDELPTTAIGALALDPSDENVLFVGTGEANYANHSRYGLGIYRSLDGGTSFEQFGEATFGGRCIASLVVDPSDGNVVYAAVARAGGFPEMAAAKGHPGASGDLGVFKSTDRGQSWTRLSASPNVATTSLVLDPTQPSRLYCGVGHIFGNASNGVWRSLDGGQSWTKLAGGLPASGSVGRVTVGIAPSQPSRLYALMCRPCDASGNNASTLGAWRSDDGGTSWTSLPVPSLQATYGWYLSVVSVHPTTPGTVFMGGLSLERSTNSGSSWSTVTPTHVDMHALAWDASGRLWAGDDGGVQRSTNNGGSWVSVQGNLGLTQFYAGIATHPSNDQRVLGGLQDNGSVRRSQTSNAWDSVLGGDGGWTQWSQANSQIAFAEFQGTGNLYKSSDGGSSFQFSGSGINSGDRNCFFSPCVFDPQNAARLFLGTQRLYRSTNTGGSWSAISADVTGGNGAIRSLAVSPADPNVIWVTTSSGRVLVSSDGGANFTLRRSAHPGWPRVMRELFPHPTDPNRVWLAASSFSGNQVLRSDDRGLTWIPLDQNLPDIPVQVVAAWTGPVDQLFAGTDRGLYYSPDGGGRWMRFGRGLPNAPVVDLLLQPERQRILVATQGRGAWSIPFAGLAKSF